MDEICPRCWHPAADHWPDHERPMTSCAVCADDKVQTTEADGRFRGTCCHPADDIRREWDEASE